jgi:lipopolysaccharide biosynthesis glycosyltransferase
MSSGAGDSHDPVVTCAADDAYALPLAVTIRSALDHLDPARRLRIHVIDAGISDVNRERLLASWPRERADVLFERLSMRKLAHVPVGGHISAASYVRILLPEILPPTLERVIYLDSDVVVLEDLGRLWDRPLAGALCLAVQDGSAPFMDVERACPRSVGHVLTPRPIENYAALGIDPCAKYFNGGVMAIDLAGWRAERLPERFLRCVEDNRAWLRFWDQYALNAVLVGRWDELDLRWNVSPYLASYPSWDRSPFEREAFERAVASPWIVHFLGPDKPWQTGSRLRYAREFHRHRVGTAWEGWRGTLACADARVARERRRLRKQRGRAGKRLSRAWRRARRWPRRLLERLRGALRPPPPS